MLIDERTAIILCRTVCHKPTRAVNTVRSLIQLLDAGGKPYTDPASSKSAFRASRAGQTTTSKSNSASRTARFPAHHKHKRHRRRATPKAPRADPQWQSLEPGMDLADSSNRINVMAIRLHTPFDNIQLGSPSHKQQVLLLYKMRAAISIVSSRRPVQPDSRSAAPMTVDDPASYSIRERLSVVAISQAATSARQRYRSSTRVGQSQFTPSIAPALQVGIGFFTAITSRAALSVAIDAPEKKEVRLSASHTAMSISIKQDSSALRNVSKCARWAAQPGSGTYCEVGADLSQQKYALRQLETSPAFAFAAGLTLRRCDALIIADHEPCHAHRERSARKRDHFGMSQPDNTTLLHYKDYDCSLDYVHICELLYS
ncbi:uncharacterized protein MYCFIDRAFT_192758 [Pseudocercospora fijiensis CIRAD86]|uniref:Uncharacterized protein n=1 Tax=Pseudocercospora fijiensis (strain CIRAD86) TaxID=383855 RepID=N1QBR1_PSEFD|nr:uncharacterized protein MYCFIDRAFT_192758 [Pseudocercospora fijiensis CIRAD86]EME88638.1 hypothetical protein MYCFIDRAFT_192758 [Pseudocercospora fijiensis CIRAD86]